MCHVPTSSAGLKLQKASATTRAHLPLAHLLLPAALIELELQSKLNDLLAALIELELQSKLNEVSECRTLIIIERVIQNGALCSMGRLTLAQQTG
jgi:hypothetical protein